MILMAENWLLILECSMAELGGILVFKSKPYFTNKEVEAQRGCKICPGPPRLEGAELGFKPRVLGLP